MQLGNQLREFIVVVIAITEAVVYRSVIADSVISKINCRRYWNT